MLADHVESIGSIQMSKTRIHGLGFELSANKNTKQKKLYSLAPGGPTLFICFERKIEKKNNGQTDKKTTSVVILAAKI